MAPVTAAALLRGCRHCRGRRLPPPPFLDPRGPMTTAAAANLPPPPPVRSRRALACGPPLSIAAARAPASPIPHGSLDRRRRQLPCHRRFHPSGRRLMSSSSPSSSWLPDAFQDWTVWGGSGYLLKALHGLGGAGAGAPAVPPSGTEAAAAAEALAAASGSFAAGVPYWACFALISLGVRLALVPLVLQGARTSSRFARVVPEVQFLLSLYAADSKRLAAGGASVAERLALMRTNLRTLSGIYKLHDIHPLAVFWSPLLQLPVFWYISVDLRKIVNGLDPALAQELVEAGAGWIPDLTEPDPWYGLPVLAGLMVYANVEVALGRRSLAGPAASKSDAAGLLRDAFQSLAVLMPCFTSQLPGGVQIYLVTSFAFTLVQSAALRSEPVRKLAGLPSMLAPPPEARYAREFLELKELEQRAAEARGDGPVLGTGVLAANWRTSFPGTRRKSTIRGSGAGASSDSAADRRGAPQILGGTPAGGPRLDLVSVPRPSGPFVHGVSAPPWQLADQQLADQQQQRDEVAPSRASVVAPEREFLAVHSDEVMDKANRGELPVATRFVPLPGATTGAAAAPSEAAARLSTKRLRTRKGPSKNRKR